MKRVISGLLIAITVILLTVPAAIATDERTSGDFTYRIKGNGTAVITGYCGSYIDISAMKIINPDIYIPRMIDGYTVTEIAPEAFAVLSCDENGQFKTSGQSMGVLVIPDTITTIGERAFMNSFFDCQTLTIPASVKYIGYGAFANTTIEEFRVAKDNEVYATIDGVLYDKVKKELIACPALITITKRNGMSIFVIPEGIKAIGDYAFFGLEFRDYHYFSLPSTLERIGNFAFARTKHFQLHNINSEDVTAFPSCLSEIGEGAFYGTGENAVSIKELELANTSLTQIPKYAFFNCTIKGDKFSLPEVLLDIHNSAFEGASFFCDTISLPRTLQTIGSRAFADGFMSNQEDEFIVPSSVITIGDEAFLNCNLEKIVLRDGVEEIGVSAFSSEWLKTLSLPTSLKKIGDNMCNRKLVTLDVQDGSYAALWASENGYSVLNTGEDDTSWLN